MSNPPYTNKADNYFDSDVKKKKKKSPLLPKRRDELRRVTTLIHIRLTPHISAASINAYLYNGRTRERLIRFHRSGSGTSYHKFRIPTCTHRRLSVMSELCFCSCQRLYHIFLLYSYFPLLSIGQLPI